MKYFNSTVALFATFLVLGILSAAYLQTGSDVAYYLALLCFLLFLLTWYIGRNQLIPTALYGALACILFYWIGFINFQLRLPEFQPGHYSNFAPIHSTGVFQLKVVEVVKPSNYHRNYISKIIYHENTPSKGKVLLSIKIDSTSKELYKVDDVLVLYAPLLSISKPQNPYHFDYSAYLKNLDVYHQFRISENEILNRYKGSRTIVGLAEEFRNYAIQQLERTKIQDDERSIIQALVLGERRDISKRLYEEYAAAGAIHILAVSGLHVGILFLILSWLLSFTEALPGGRFIKTILLLLLLWGFALLSGLSASVIRAVTMFSFFSMAQLSRRPTNSYNTLFLSFFILLLINPKWLFHVGFQLSYIAVLSILLLQPILFKVYIPKNLLLKKLWGIITVSIAAQIGILPLSLYYFHQFPGLFLITNVIVLPFLGLLLTAGIIVVILSSLNILPEILAEIYDQMIRTLNLFIGWIADQKFFIIENIHFSLLKMFGSYVLLICLLWTLRRPSYKNYVFLGGCSLFFAGILVYTKQELSQQELIFFQKYKHTLIGHPYSENLLLLNKDGSQEDITNSPLKQYITAKNVQHLKIERLPSLFKFEDRNILVMDSDGVFPCSFRAEIILLTQNSRVNLERLIDCLKPKLVIADGSNSPFYTGLWKATCEQRELDFHNTSQQGAYILRQSLYK